MKIFLVVTCLLTVICFLSCSKDSGPDVISAATKLDNISSGAWKYESGGVDQDKNGTIDIPGSALFGSCSLDNTIIFKKDNTGITDEGGTKCNSSDPQSAQYKAKALFRIVKSHHRAGKNVGAPHHCTPG